MHIHLRHSLPLWILFALLVAIVLPSQVLRAAQPATVVTTIPVGGLPNGLAVAPRIHRAYVANGRDNTVSVIDTQTNTVIATIPVGALPFDVAVNPRTDRVYVTNQGAETVSVIDATTNRVVATIHLGQGEFLHSIAVNPSTNQAYVAKGANAVAVLDLTTNTVVTTIPVGRQPYGVAVDQGKERAYVVNIEDATMSVINTQTNTVVATIFSVEVYPTNVAVNPFTNRAYVTDGEGVVVINTTSNTVLTDIFILGADGTGGANDVAVNVARQRAYAARAGDGTVRVLDLSSNTVVATIPVGSFPFFVAVDPQTNRVYVSNYGSNTVSVFTGL